MIAPADATDVQRHRRRSFDQDDPDNHRCAVGAIDVGRHERAVAARHALGLVLHVCCTRADLIRIGDRL
jgi:hypothetical protein